MKKTKTITLRITEECYEILNQYANTNNISVSKLIRKLFDRFILGVK